MCNEIKNTPATCHIPFIFLSAKGSEDQQMEGYEVGADAYIAKPFHTAHLKLRIRKLLEYRQKLHDFFKNDRADDLLPEPDIESDDKIFLTKLNQIIEENLDEPGLNAVFIEKAFGMSKMQLFRKLKTLTGHDTRGIHKAHPLETCGTFPLIHQFDRFGDFLPHRF